MEVEMFSQTTIIDRNGRITLPRPILAALGVHTSSKTEVTVELTEIGVVIKAKQPVTPLTDLVAAMDLPVADWPQMEQEVEAGRLE